MNYLVRKVSNRYLSAFDHVSSFWLGVAQIESDVSSDVNRFLHDYSIVKDFIEGHK